MVRCSVCVVLAAGKGTRMRSRIPKVLHPILGAPMIHYVISTVQEVAEKTVVVVGHGAQEVERALDGFGVTTAVQEQQLGTAHAVSAAAESLAGAREVLVVCGDTPMLRSSTLSSFVERHREAGAALSVLTCIMADPKGYGRIIRRGEDVLGIVEEQDASADQRQIREVNAGVYLFSGDFLLTHLPKVQADNAQGEYYLTDLVGMAVSEGYGVAAFCLAGGDEAIGINDRRALSDVEQMMLRDLRRQWMDRGVSFENAPTIYLEPSVVLGEDVVLGPNVVLKGRTEIGPGARIGAFSFLENQVIEEGTEVPPFTVKRS